MNQVESIVKQFESLGLSTSEDYIIACIRDALPNEVNELECPIDSRELVIEDVLEHVWDVNEDSVEEFVDFILN